MSLGETKAVESLEHMITDYKDSGNRVDEVLFQEVMKAVEKVEAVEKENQWLYGRLNLISDIIEKGRTMPKVGESNN